MNARTAPWPGVTFRTLEVSDPRFERDELRHVTVKSAALAQRADVTVHATAAARAGADVPLVILLHGVYGSHWAWALKGGAHATSARLQASGEIPPLVIAMPSDGLWGDGSGYVRHRAQDFARWIVDEVPAAVAHAAGSVTRRSRVCIAGLSMGGFGALRLAAAYPGRFAAAAAHSAITEFDGMSRFVEEPLARYAVAAEDASVLAAMRRHRATLPPVRFDCGTEDPLLEANRALHHALQADGIAHEYAEFPGGHEWAYWETHLADSLRFFAGVLRGNK